MRLNELNFDFGWLAAAAMWYCVDDTLADLSGVTWLASVPFWVAAIVVVIAQLLTGESWPKVVWRRCE